MWPVLFTHWSQFPVSLVLSSVPYELKPRIFNSGGSAKEFFFFLPLQRGCLSKSTKIVEIIGAFAEAASLTTEGDFDA